MEESKTGTVPKPTSEAPKNDSMRIVLVVLSILLIFSIGSVIYLLFEYRSLNSEIEDLNQQVLNLTNSISVDKDQEEDLENGNEKLEDVDETKESFYVEYRKGDGGVVFLEATIPEESEVVYSSEGETGGRTVITYESSELLEFTIPHSGIHESVTVDQSLEDSLIYGLYRVSSIEESGLQNYYSTDLSLTGECDTEISPKPSTPCAAPKVEIESDIVSVGFVGDPIYLPVADKIMMSLEFVNDVSPTTPIE